MTPKRKIRLVTAALILTGGTIAAALILTAFEKNLMYFYSPSDVIAGEAPTGRKFRVGGLVVNGSVKRIPRSLTVEFTLSDTVHEVTVEYEGILPDLFREGQGIVAHGKSRPDGTFEASEVLAKHDENYMPPEVASALAAAKSNTPRESAK
ncbi:MAG TPA: cytochrome c maturation protein CcmE [Gammaproteobacteria bacterium]|nr:cytochrome c maturation protein CcmE [Gammaproteobacteria bacterium]|tara:strand:+ start:400 stop:852 length:453 start_codon:yes stop_codon:yes gene_type:complete